jgi:hypothetical protein
MKLCQLASGQCFSVTCYAETGFKGYYKIILPRVATFLITVDVRRVSIILLPQKPVLLQAVNDHVIALRLKPMNATPSAVVVSLAVVSSEGDELAML